MSSEQDKSTNKILLLYLVKKLPGSTESDLTGVAVGSLLLDYFSFSELLDGLQSQAFLYKAPRKDDPRKSVNGQSFDRYYLTELGEKILAELEADLPVGLRNSIDLQASRKRLEYERMESVFAAYEADGNGYFRVNLRLLADGIEQAALTFSSLSEEQARLLGRRWKENAIRYYPQILSLLIATDAQEPDLPAPAE